MAKELAGKTKNVSSLYPARKSQNEMYYQMASVFKQSIKREDKYTEKMLKRLLSVNNLNISLEKAV